MILMKVVEQDEQVIIDKFWLIYWPVYIQVLYGIF